LKLLLILLAILLFLAIVAEVRAVPCDHYAVVSEYITARDKARAERRRLRQLRIRFEAWRDRQRLRIHDRAYGEVGTYGGWKYGRSTLWCGVFVDWCCPEFCDPYNPALSWAWADAIRRGRHFCRIWKRQNVKPGDVVAFTWGHVGIVHRKDGAGFWSIGGNESNAVRLRWHAWSEAVCFGRVVFPRPARFAEL
jgi:hypothetical protein